MTGPILMTLAAALWLVAAAPFSDDTRPSQVGYAGARYDVDYGSDGHIYLARNGVHMRDLGYGQQLLQVDFDVDGTLDLGVYSDERDGFRHTFAYLDLWPNDGHGLAEATPVSAKWKDGHWIWIDVARYPVLDKHSVASLWFRRFMREQDRAHEW